jgi:glycosyltransferase involved in cell wall biosynthesis
MSKNEHSIANMEGKIQTICMLVFNYFPNEIGGAEHQCQKLSHEMAVKGLTCVVLTARLFDTHRKTENDRGVTIVRIWTTQTIINKLIKLRRKIDRKKINFRSEKPTNFSGYYTKSNKPQDLLEKSVHWLNAFSFMVGVWWFIFKKRNEIDIIHTHIASWNAGFAGWLGNLYKIPVVCKAAFIPPFHEYGKSIPFGSKWKIWRTQIQYIAMLPEIEHMLHAQGVPLERIYLVPNGVFLPKKKAPIENNNLVLYVGNFSQGSGHKGFDILFKSWAIVCGEIQNVKLVIAGGGDRTHWTQMACELGCMESISFLGYVKNMENIYLDAGLFVLPSRAEGMSNALLEAQSFGIPAVVSDIPGNREVVVHGETGLIVPINDVKKFAKAMVRILQNETLRVKMGTRARIHVEEKFSMKNISDQVLEVYDCVCKNNP